MDAVARPIVRRREFQRGIEHGLEWHKDRAEFLGKFFHDGAALIHLRDPILRDHAARQHERFAQDESEARQRGLHFNQEIGVDTLVLRRGTPFWLPNSCQVSLTPMSTERTVGLRLMTSALMRA